MLSPRAVGAAAKLDALTIAIGRDNYTRLAALRHEQSNKTGCHLVRPHAVRRLGIRPKHFGKAVACALSSAGIVQYILATYSIRRNSKHEAAESAGSLAIDLTRSLGGLTSDARVN